MSLLNSLARFLGLVRPSTFGVKHVDPEMAAEAEMELAARGF